MHHTFSHINTRCSKLLTTSVTCFLSLRCSKWHSNTLGSQRHSKSSTSLYGRLIVHLDSRLRTLTSSSSGLSGLAVKVVQVTLTSFSWLTRGRTCNATWSWAIMRESSVVICCWSPKISASSLLEFSVGRFKATSSRVHSTTHHNDLCMN